jgi:vancomycin resistance protein VanJ
MRRDPLNATMAASEMPMTRLVKDEKDKLETTRPGARHWITMRLITLTRVYFTWLFAWAILRLLFGDRWWWLFLLNTFAEYLFLPLPVILGIAILARRRETWLGFGVALALGVYLYGGLFLPKSPAAHSDDVTLTVMSYNMLGFNEHPERVVAAIRAADADVIAVQELNPPAAEAIQRELAEVYPYQVLDPQWGTTGCGVISRYALHPSGESLPGEWIGTPQVLTLDFDGKTVTLLHFHTFPTNVGREQGLRSKSATIEWSVREREWQAQAIVDFVVAHPGPIIAATDFNAGDQSRAYALVTDVLVDSWREAGWGLGHTFPGAASLGSSRPTVAGIPVPRWLIRIDYVFHSKHWRVLSAHVGPWDGISDHRPVVVKLTLLET